MTIALATTAAAHPFDDDHAPLRAALEARGHAVEAPCWDDPAVEWSRYALVLPRATWNYIDRLDAFLAWAARVAAASRLANDPATIRWNVDKRYLLELERAGVPVIPTAVAEPGRAWRPVDAPEFVVKPAVGAGSRGARRYTTAERDAARAHAAALQATGVAVLTQPYLASVDTAGETALVYVDGRFSHAIRKGAILERAEGPVGELFDPARVNGLFAPERITPRTPAADELAVGERAMAALCGRTGAPLLYARVDLIRDAGGAPRLLELELIEPSLFFAHAAGSAERFAAAVEARLPRTG